MDSESRTVDPLFECDAPTYVDFEKLKAGTWDDEDIDQWFDTHRDEEGGIFIMDENEEQLMHLNKEEVEKLAEEEGELPPVAEEMEVTDAPVNPFGDDFSSHAQTQGEDVEEEGDNVVCSDSTVVSSAGQEGSTSKPVDKNDIFKIWKDMTSKDNSSAVSKPLPCHQPPSKKENAPETSGRSYSTTVTIPETPEVYRRYRLKQAMKAEHSKNSEDIELEAIAKRRKEAVQVLKMSKESFNKLRSTKPTGKVIKPERHAITKVREFTFHSQKNVHESQKASKDINPSDYPSMLRTPSCFSSAPQQRKGGANIKPFSVASKLKKANGNYISVAEVVANFHKRTPDRFHSISTKDPAARLVGTGPQTSTSNVPVVTRPKSPNLHTKSRVRPSDILSHVEKEKQEIEEKQKQQFKARPLNSKILDPSYHGMCGVVKEATRPATKPITPKLATAQREVARKNHEKSQPPSNSTAFKAQEIPKHMFECVKGVPEKRTNEVTFPQSPALLLKKRKVTQDKECLERTTSSDDLSEGSSSLLSQPDKPVFKPHVEHKHTEVKPFKFEERYQNKPNRDDYIRRKLEEEQKQLTEKRNFHAHPIVTGAPIHSKPPPPPTKAEPFNFQTDVRGHKYQEEFERKKLDLLNEEKAKAEFKATENTIIHNKPFVPKPQLARKPLVEVDPFVLNTDIRAEHRKVYELQKMKMDEDQQMQLAAERESMEREEHRRLMEYRKNLVHHAQPVRHYKPTKIKRSERLPTKPHSPKFATNERCNVGKSVQN